MDMLSKQNPAVLERLKNMATPTAKVEQPKTMEMEAEKPIAREKSRPIEASETG
jgi:hypothetical protein